jgi:hypothetical protein
MGYHNAMATIHEWLTPRKWVPKNDTRIFGRQRIVLEDSPAFLATGSIGEWRLEKMS